MAGMAVPGTSPGAFLTNCINTPGWFGSRPAIRPCRAKPCRDGPSPPRGHGTSGKVWQATQPFSVTSRKPLAALASPSVGVRSGGPSQATRPKQASNSQAPDLPLGELPNLGLNDDLDPMRKHLSRHTRRPANVGNLLLALSATVLTTACTDRMATSEDRFGRSGELVAMSGGEGGARYACATCHGVRGEGNGFDAPRLAGLPAGYLQKQMEDFAAGLRPHAAMRDVARFLDSHERVQVANHYAAMPPQALAPATAETIDAATPALYARTCQQCHGVDGVGTVNGPPLNAQPAFYLTQQLQDWQVAKRRNDGDHVMLKVAQELKAGEVRQLSLYLARIPPRPASPDR